MIEAVFIDLDGTLLNENHEISQANRLALKDLEKRNISFFIATGRPEQLVKKIVDDLNYKKPLIMYNGSVIGHPFKTERMLNLTLNDHTTESIVKYCQKNNHIVMLYTQHAIFSDRNERVDFFEEKNKTYSVKHQAIFKMLSEYQGEEVNKILIVERNDLRYKTVKAFVNKLDVSTVQSQHGFLDVNPLNASKGNAAREIMKHFNIDPTKTLAIGDQENDLSMLDSVNRFVAMGNATESVKNKADDVTLSNSDNGVAYCLAKYVINTEQMFNNS